MSGAKLSPGALYGAFVIAMGLQSAAAIAAESIAAAGPIGGTDINAAFLPPEGLWVSGIGATVGFSDYYDDGGTQLRSRGNDTLGGVGILYSYPGKFYGGQLASTLFTGYERLCFGVAQYAKNCSSGVKDIYSDVLMWSRYFPSDAALRQSQDDVQRPFGTAVLVGLGLTIPTGNYDKVSPINNSANFWGFSPNIALTYTAPSPLPDIFGDAVQLNGRLFYHMYTENKDTQYQTGSVLSLDWAVVMMKGQWKYGLAGMAYTQLEDDTIGGVVHPNNGNRSEVIGFGPIISRDFMMNDHPANLTIKGIQSVYGRNVAKSTGVFIRLSVKL
ncbi:transporter [Agrobacterium rhizogenes]|uniref:SphA family protein n=1 Tax=Rhizobium rhizogenes TaxID=359 RepID=UPI00115CAAA7|nr:transporter [Rhizobium rhizogenes]NTG90856.1 transporter [Rhizobium rhizogenes]NTI20129.1 transporter [Rhizobium rhizogenes]NTI39178.1 transporter [Rhizobium rhizogenes]TRB19861.1 transporter [Rhizobium rhizogenes]WEO69110.1 transporter [Rhizobium rhizogenes]